MQSTKRIAIDLLTGGWPREKGSNDTQDTDKCQDRQLYTDISVWITDAKICLCLSGHKGYFLSLWRNLSSQQPVCSTNAQLTPMMNV